MKMKLPILPCADKLELVLSTAPESSRLTWTFSEPPSFVSGKKQVTHAAAAASSAPVAFFQLWQV